MIRFDNVRKKNGELKRMIKKLPIGTSDFKTLISEGFYYVDKTLFLKELMDRGDRILLIPRPRRFGKTLNLSMVYYYFGKNVIGANEENRKLFKNLAIEKAGAAYTQKMGRHPIIFLTFKDIKQLNYEDALKKIYSLIVEEYLKHPYLREGNILQNVEIDYYNKIIRKEGDLTEYEESLGNLLKFLHRHYNEKVIILIDEYDAPIHAGYNNGYYDKIVSFMRNFLSGALKDTDRYLEKSVITGIMRMAQESIFSELNNPGVYTLLSNAFSGSFGFTEKEVKGIIKDYNSTNKYEAIKNWYNGYLFGKETIYNPWSIIQFISNPDDGLKPYWINTSDNKIIEELLIKGGQKFKKEIDVLLEGQSVKKEITENIVFSNLKEDEGHLWSFLLFGGYLKAAEIKDSGLKKYYSLEIPNKEVAFTYIRLVDTFFQKKIDNAELNEMLKALLEEDIETFEEIFADLVIKTLSFFDLPEKESENVFHAFTAGLFVWLSNTHKVKSNRESGYGRYDIMLIPKDTSKAGLIIEFKVIRPKETRDGAIAAAFKQIEEKKYETELNCLGIKKVRKLAIVFKGKEALVREKV